jgi:hypothetical protein
VQRRSHLVWLLLLIFAICISNARAALIEHNLVVDPVFFHDAGKSSSYTTSSSFRVDLPSVTLSPGDLLRVTVELTRGRYLKLLPTAVDGSQSYEATLAMVSGQQVGTTGYGDGVTHTAQIFEANLNLLDEEVLPASYLVHQNAPRLRVIRMELSRGLDYGEPTDHTFRKWIFEIQAPTTITLGSGENFAHQPTTFPNPYIRIFHLFQPRYEEDQVPVAVYVVPEPATIISLGVIGVAAVFYRRSFMF